MACRSIARRFSTRCIDGIFPCCAAVMVASSTGSFDGPFAVELYTLTSPSTAASKMLGLGRALLFGWSSLCSATLSLSLLIYDAAAECKKWACGPEIIIELSVFQRLADLLLQKALGCLHAQPFRYHCEVGSLALVHLIAVVGELLLPRCSPKPRVQKKAAAVQSPSSASSAGATYGGLPVWSLLSRRQSRAAARSGAMDGA